MPRALSSCSLSLSLVVVAACGGPPQEDVHAAAGAAASLPSACATLRPQAFPAPVEASSYIGTHGACSETTSHPTGNVALGFYTGGKVSIRIYSSSGVPSGDGYQIMDLYRSSPDLDPWFHFTAAGWRGIAATPAPQLDTYSAAGALTSTLTTRYVVWSAPDGQGGTVAVGDDVATRAPVLSWVDAGGTVRREVALDRAATLVAVSWATRHVLVIAPGASTPPSIANARWFDDQGRALTPWFSTHVALGTSMLRLLRDGRPVLANDGVWQVAFRDGSTTVDRAPAWLTSRPGTRLATVPGGYAVLTDRGATPPALELLTADGQSCGTLTPPPAAVPAGAASRSALQYRIGQDGTLLESAYVAGQPGTIDNFCTTRWWPRLFVPR